MSVDMKTTKDGHEYLEFTTGSGYVLGSRKNKKKVSEKRNSLSKHVHGKTYPELIESNLSDLKQKVKDLKNNNYNMSAIMDVQSYARSIEHWAKLLEVEIEK